MNKANIQKVIDVIEAHPESWSQTKWHCGTAHCFAGHAQILSGKDADRETVRTDARIFLDLDMSTANWVFNANRTLVDFKSLLTDASYNRDGYDSYRYDRDGYNRDGYDSDGYDRAGYNCDGYDSYRYDRDGYNRDGYDGDGYNCEGYDRDGYDSDGYNCEGYDSDGYDRDGYDSDRLDINNKPRQL